MRVIEFIAVVLYGSIIVSEDIRGKAIKGFEDLGCSRMGSITVFWVELERWMFCLPKSLADEAFQQRLDHQGDKEEEHVSLNSADFFKEQRCGSMNAFELGEAFLQPWLKLIGLKDLLGTDGWIGAQQRENSIGPGFAQQCLFIA